MALFAGAVASVSAQEISRSVVSAAGGQITDEASGVSASWTVGEAIVGDLSSSDGSIVISQGFQQGASAGTVYVIPIAATPQITVFPNPTTSVFNVRVENPGSEPLTLEIYDMQGRVCGSHSDIANQDLLTISADNLASGAYNLCFKAGERLLKTVRMVKE